jgi:hypothetical protein
MSSGKPWYKSKTKWGAFLVGLAAIVGTVGGWLSGAADLNSTILALVTEVGAVLAVFGVRDLPFINKK